MSDDTISRQAAIDALHMHLMYRMGTDSNKKRLDDWINSLPSAHPERKKGKWIPVTNGRGGFECDQCHNYAPSYQDGVEWLSGFCPNCGADMRGEQDEH